MIVLASDYVGLQIVNYLVDRAEPIQWLLLDAGDRGGYNAEIRAAFEQGRNNGRVADGAALRDEVFLDSLSALKLQLGILAWWPHLIKGRPLTLPQRGWLNLHPGYLPHNQGKHPNFWCLVDETPCGAALHVIDAGVDTGPVLARSEVPVCWEDTGESVYQKCRQAAIDLFEANFHAVRDGVLRASPQEEDRVTKHRGGDMERASEINLDCAYTARNLLNIIRARMFPPYPTAFFREGGKKYGVQVVIREMEDI